MTDNADTERIEWAELWPDGQVRPVHLNATPIGSPTKRPPFAHRGTVWVRRTVTYGAWTQSDGLDGAGNIRNDRGDELIHHGGPLDGQPLNVMAPPGPHDDAYEVRLNDDGRILGAWWVQLNDGRDGG